MPVDKDNAENVRLDKWLWAARFFKTRSLATEAINGGKIHQNGVRGKPSRKVTIGDSLEITRGLDVYIVEVVGLASKRGSATIAQSLYVESEDSIKKRSDSSEQRKLLRASRAAPDGRPTKKDRREIRKLKES
jgi:ribosome-associated heat shock protein Hsp15